MMYTDISILHPLSNGGFIGYRGPTETPVFDDDEKSYGFELNLTTCCYWYTYDWGWGFCIRVLGFGVYACFARA